jgi:parvulin-like peptidyl-prolyl isomerase
MTHHPGWTSCLLGRPAKGMAIGILAVLWACETESRRVLARAAGHELTVDQMVEMLARQNTVPNQADLVDALANFWVDYTLIAVSAREDSLFTTLDLEPLLRPQLDQEIIDLYMDSVLQPDTAISDQDLRTMWEADSPPDSVRAQHILLAFPDQATQAQVDSVAEFAAQLKARAAAGESFEALAGQYSEDAGSAVQGGDIGFFSLGVMVPSFEEAAFSLAVGEVSDPVLSSLGLHVIKVTDRKAPTFEAARNSYRDSIVLRRLLEANSAFLAGVDQEAEIEVAAEAVDVMRELAMNPRTTLSGRAASRTLVSYHGGSYLVSDALLLLNTRQADLPAQLAVAPNEALHDLLNLLGQAQVLLARAADAGIGLAGEHLDSLNFLARQGLREATDELGIRRIPLSAGETADDAIDRTILQILRELSAGTRSVIPMDAITVALRRDLDWDILESAIGATVERIDDLRGSTEATPTQPAVVAPGTPPVLDSVQN